MPARVQAPKRPAMTPTREQILAASAGWVAVVLNLFPGVGNGYLYQRRWKAHWITVAVAIAPDQKRERIWAQRRSNGPVFYNWMLDRFQNTKHALNTSHVDTHFATSRRYLLRLTNLLAASLSSRAA